MPYERGKRVVIFTNGMVNNPDYYRQWLKENDMIVCADGGTAIVLDMGIIPDLVVGDMDSLSTSYMETLEENRVPIQRFPAEKEQSDLELAMEHAIKMEPVEIVIMGAFGGRIDHVYANVMLLAIPLKDGIPARIIDESGEVRLIDSELVMCGEKGDYLSLLPVSPEVRGVVTTGLKYPLSGETLFYSSSRGLSNEFLTTEARVNVESGLLLAIKINRDNL